MPVIAHHDCTLVRHSGISKSKTTTELTIVQEACCVAGWQNMTACLEMARGWGSLFALNASSLKAHLAAAAFHRPYGHVHVGAYA